MTTRTIATTSSVAAEATPHRRRTRLRLPWLKRSHGQSLVEFAVVFPVFVLFLGGVIQFGVILWGQNTINQIVRDTGRWEATQQASPCKSIGAGLATQANQIAVDSSLIGYTNGEWGSLTTYADNSALPANPPSSNGIEAVWSLSSGTSTCPPSDNTSAWFVTIRVSHVVPIFFPWVPGNGALTSTTQFRMEPKP